MNKSIVLGAFAVLAVVAVFWSIDKSMKARPGSTGNNGYTSEVPRGPSPEMQERMRKAFEGRQVNTEMPKSPEEGMRRGMEMMKQLSAEDQQEMRKMMQEGRERMERTQAILGEKESRELMQRAMRTFGRMGREGRFGQRNRSSQDGDSSAD